MLPHLAGFFRSTPITCAGGSISNMRSAEARTVAFPVEGGYIGQSSLLNNGRWTEWITLIWAGVIMFMIVSFLLPETSGLSSLAGRPRTSQSHMR
jgi:hypothetical protein